MVHSLHLLSVSRHQRNRKLRRPHIKKTNKEYDTNFSVSVRPPKLPSEHTIITEARLKLFKGRFRIQADKKAFASDVKRSMVMDYFIVINCVLNAPLMLLSIIGNSLGLSAILRTPSLCSPSVIFLRSLAVSDLLVGLVMQPLYKAHELKSGPVLCRIAVTFFTIACSASLFTMTAISVDRFLALRYHMRYPNLMTEKRAIYTSATIWKICILAPSLLSCLSLWHKSYAVLAVAIAICLLISTFSYIRIYQIVRRHQLQIHAQQQAVQNLNNGHNQNMVR